MIVLPDARDLDRVDAALTATLPAAGQEHVCLTADLGPAERYRRWLAVRRGQVRVVAGTRAAMFAPVAELGLVVLWDDGDDLHAEPRAPYPHAREVLALRAHRTGAAALIGGFARTAELTQLVAGGWARPLAGRPDDGAAGGAAGRGPPRDEAELARDAAAMTARLPSLALRDGPGGRSPTGRCWSRCRGAATWPPSPAAAAARRPGAPTCGGPLEIGGSHETPGCRWCGALAAGLDLRPLRRAAGCARSSPARRAPPRNWAAPFPACRCAPRAASTCSPPCPPSPRWSSPPRGPSRWRRAATPPRSCSTAGRCSAGPACAPPRRRCAAG